MIRKAAAGALALMLFIASVTTAAPATRWSDLNTALAPANVGLRTDAQKLALDIANFGTAAQDVFFNGSPFNPERTNKSIASLKVALAAVQKSIRAVQADAVQGVKVLDSFTWEDCYRHFAAMEYVMFASWQDTAVGLLTNSDSSAVGAAIYLAGLNPKDLTPLVTPGPLDIQWDKARTACDPSAKPSAAPSPSG